MADLKEYKCPKCGAAITYDGVNQQMHCEYCGSKFEMDVAEALDHDMETEKPDDFDWKRESEKVFAEGENIAVYSCESCGGEVVGERNTTAMFCPYCGNPVVMKGNCDGELMPDFIIPFKLEKRTAKDTFYRHLSGKKLLPKVFRTEAHIDEIKGIYVPFWMFSADADGKVSYRGEKIRRWYSGGYDYTERSYYSIYRNGSLSFQNIPADASQKFANDLMDSLEPYRMNEKKEFRTAYLSGFYADRFDVSVDDSISRADKRAKKSVEEKFKSTVKGYTSLTVQNSQISLHNGECRYAMLPVWILDTTWKGVKYRFAMNGQTGKFVGNLPLDKGLYWKYWFLWFGIFFAVAFLLLFLIL